MLKAHTPYEIELFLKATACRQCGRSMRAADDQLKPDASGLCTVTAKCLSCGSAQDFGFLIETAALAPRSNRPPVINHTDRPSRILDLGQWTILSQVFREEARNETDRARARVLNLQAAQCLDEALKFFDDPENDLPPAEAFFCEASRTRFRNSPQQFARSRLIGERAKLPNVFGVG